MPTPDEPVTPSMWQSSRLLQTGDLLLADGDPTCSSVNLYLSQNTPKCLKFSGVVLSSVVELTSLHVLVRTAASGDSGSSVYQYLIYSFESGLVEEGGVLRGAPGYFETATLCGGLEGGVLLRGADGSVFPVVTYKFSVRVPGVLGLPAVGGVAGGVGEPALGKNKLVGLYPSTPDINILVPRISIP